MVSIKNIAGLGLAAFLGCQVASPIPFITSSGNQTNHSITKYTTQVQATLSQSVQMEKVTPTPTSTVTPPRAVEVVEEEPSLSSPVEIGQALARDYGWSSGYEWQSLYNLWMRESGWNPKAYNYNSGACGIVQALPCSKLGGDLSTTHQVEWGLSYIRSRYGDPANAWDHELYYGWY